MMQSIPRLDILIYAHDGRGLGHASRSIGIGMALKRLYPELKVLFVSGCKFSGELIGKSSLDWMKLPSYETRVIDGKSRGVIGNSGYQDKELGHLREEQLKQYIQLYRPRLVLCDHTPQGKHKELVPAIEYSSSNKTLWVLGLRGVVGGVSQVHSKLASHLFRENFCQLLWYGDSAILGKSHLQQLKLHYGYEPTECGYVSRLIELGKISDVFSESTQRYAGTIAIPWLGEKSQPLLQSLALALQEIGPQYGKWRLFIDSSNNKDQQLLNDLFAPLSHCLLEQPSGSRYVEALFQSKTAVIYGGYNSIMDVLSLEMPAVVVLREMSDGEQQIHLERLRSSSPDQLLVVEEEVGSLELKETLEQCLARGTFQHSAINLDGAENAANQLVQLLEKAPVS